MKMTLLKGIKTVLIIGGAGCLLELGWALGKGFMLGSMLSCCTDDAKAVLDKIFSERQSGIKAVEVAIVKSVAKDKIEKSR